MVRFLDRVEWSFNFVQLVKHQILLKTKQGSYVLISNGEIEASFTCASAFLAINYVISYLLLIR